MLDKKAQGKSNRRKGLKLEAKVREDLEKRGYIVSKWQNNIDLDKKTLISAKGNRFRARTLGFPDFVAFKRVDNLYLIVFVEVKSTGYLTSEEKQKASILMDLTKIPVYIASKEEYGLITYKFIMTALNFYDVKGGI